MLICQQHDCWLPAVFPAGKMPVLIILRAWGRRVPIEGDRKMSISLLGFLSSNTLFQHKMSLKPEVDSNTR